MILLKKMSGVVTALMTATDLCGNPDLEATLSMANYCREGCVDGLFVSGTNGEGANFSVSQRLKIAERILTQLDRSEMTVCIHT